MFISEFTLQLIALILAITFIVMVTAIWLLRSNNADLETDKTKLQDQVTELTTEVSKTREEIEAEILEPYLDHRQAQMENMNQRLRNSFAFGFRLPTGPNVRVVNTPIGTFAIRTIGGYFGESAVFVYFPIGFGYSEEVAEALYKATDGRFIMNQAPGASSGGDNFADAIITAGLDYNAFQRGEQGYFKESPAPDLDEIATILGQIIVFPRGVTAPS